MAPVNAVEAMDKLERPYLDAFRRFYATLERKDDIFYMFFSSGLVHVARKALEFIPPHTNVVLVSSALTPDELRWVEDNVRRPLHNIDLNVDDKTVWEFLFLVNERDFGWIDADCFVLDGAILGEMAALGPQVAVAGIFPFSPLPLLGTPFTFFSADAIRRVAASDAPTSPCTYSYHPSRAGRFAPNAFSRVLTPAHVEIVRATVETDARGRPVNPQGGILEAYTNGLNFPLGWRSEAREAFGDAAEPMFVFFDTMVLFQMAVLRLGYTLRTVDNRAPSGALRVLHTGGIGYHRRLLPGVPGDTSLAGTQESGVMARLLANAVYLDLLAVEEFVEEVEEAPTLYVHLRDELRALATRMGVSTVEVARRYDGFLRESGVAGVATEQGWRFVRRWL